MSDKSEEKQRLLIVDDSKVIRVTARKILRDHFETIEAVDGENAWDILNGDMHVSLVVSDLTMPNLDGFGLLSRIRNSHLPHIRELPVIIITGANDTETTMERARQAGATDFIGKPFDAVHLLARTQTHANSHAVTNTLKEENTALEDRSTIDPLTGLANEAAFMERGYQQLSYAIRHNKGLTLFRIEIDRYGTVYRQYGESFSESIIQTLAKILSTSARQEDVVARIGTARFALLLLGMNKAGIHNLAERINSNISTRIFKSGNDKATVTVSIGVASPEIRRDIRLSELIAIADQRLTRAITRGGNQVVYGETTLPDATHETEQVMLTEPGTGNHAEAAFVSIEPQTIANARNLLPIEDMEVEEIEIFSPGFPYDHFSTANKKAGATEYLAAEIPERISNTFSGPVPEKMAVVPAPVAMSERHGGTAPVPVISPVACSGNPAVSMDALESDTSLSGDDQDSTVLLTPLFANVAADRPEQTAALTCANREQVKNRHSAAKPKRVTRRHGFLKRTLAWFGLIRSGM
jgi:diguanylate cyclase (GGDEF)-like protein